METPETARRGRLLLIAALIALLVGVPGTAWAYWSASTSLTTPLSGASYLPTPSPTCSNQSTGGIIPTPFVRITWPAVPAASSYTVRLRNLSGSTNTVFATTSATTVDVNQGALVGLLASLLTLLLGGGTVYVTVTATNANGWSSLPSVGLNSNPGTPIRASGGGLICGP